MSCPTGYGVASCQHGALRLVNGGTSNQGRLEICIYSVWGTVCDDSFDTNDARVACRQLGYEVDNGQSKLHYNTDFQCIIAVTFSMCIDGLYCTVKIRMLTIRSIWMFTHFGQGTGPIHGLRPYWTIATVLEWTTEQNILECPRHLS